jgi:hypothetical protein
MFLRIEMRCKDVNSYQLTDHRVRLVVVTDVSKTPQRMTEGCTAEFKVTRMRTHSE